MQLFPPSAHGEDRGREVGAGRTCDTAERQPPGPSEGWIESIHSLLSLVLFSMCLRGRNIVFLFKSLCVGLHERDRWYSTFGWKAQTAAFKLLVLHFKGFFWVSNWEHFKWLTLTPKMKTNCVLWIFFLLHMNLQNDEGERDAFPVYKRLQGEFPWQWIPTETQRVQTVEHKAAVYTSCVFSLRHIYSFQANKAFPEQGVKFNPCWISE